MSGSGYGAGPSAGQAIFTDDVSLQVFMEHLKRLVSYSLWRGFLAHKGTGRWGVDELRRVCMIVYDLVKDDGCNEERNACSHLPLSVHASIHKPMRLVLF